MEKSNISDRKMFDRAQTSSRTEVNRSIPDGYLVNGYFEDNTTVLRSEYVLSYAQNLAQSLASERPSIKKTQLRGFYDKVKNARDNYERNFITLEDALLNICELASLANNSVNKGNAPKLFKQFIDKNVQYITSNRTYEALKAFEQHFRAILCYYPENKR